MGLVFWSLPLGLVVAGVFLVALANTPGDTPGPANPPARGDRRAEAHR